MSVMYCEKCDKYIDTDYNTEHFTCECGAEPEECESLCNKCEEGIK